MAVQYFPAVSNGQLEVMVSSLEHEDDKSIISDFVKVILEELEIEFRSLGSTTFKSKAMRQAVKPDECFYIKNEAKIRGKKKINLEFDPPPDLALEIDLNSSTNIDNYQQLSVLELWRFDGRKLEIHVLQNKKYLKSKRSLHFPQLPIVENFPKYLKQSKSIGRNKTMKLFRSWVREKIS